MFLTLRQTQFAAFMERRMAKQMTDVHRTVAAGRFRGLHGWCVRKMQELRTDVRAGVRNIRDYGIGCRRLTA